MRLRAAFLAGCAALAAWRRNRALLRETLALPGEPFWLRQVHGVAVADAPAGPWQKLPGNPVLSPNADATQFDSMRVDDAALVVRNGKVWFYYKGRIKGKGPGETKLGVAFADSPTGPFTKQGEPMHAGHEVMVWPQGKGVASLATAAGPRACRCCTACRPSGRACADCHRISHPDRR